MEKNNNDNEELRKEPKSHYTLRQFKEFFEFLKIDEKEVKEGKITPFEYQMRELAYLMDELESYEDKDYKYFSDIWFYFIHSRGDNIDKEMTFEEHTASEMLTINRTLKEAFYNLIHIIRSLQIEYIFPIIRHLNEQAEQINLLQTQINELKAKFRYAGYASYQEYLQSPYWKEIRKRALERAGNHCSVCRSIQNLNVHHNNYERLGKELDTDLIVLCEKCHTLFYKEGKLSDPENK